MISVLICLSYYMCVMRCPQFLKAAQDGSADKMLELLGSGANIEHKDKVRRICPDFRLIHICRHVRISTGFLSLTFVFVFLLVVRLDSPRFPRSLVVIR
jgi:hypothetical protein